MVCGIETENRGLFDSTFVFRGLTRNVTCKSISFSGDTQGLFLFCFVSSFKTECMAILRRAQMNGKLWT